MRGYSENVFRAYARIRIHFEKAVVFGEYLVREYFRNLLRPREDVFF